MDFPMFLKLFNSAAIALALALATEPCSARASTAAARQPEIFEIWKGREMPGTGAEKPLSKTGSEENDTLSFTNVSVPDLAFYRAARKSPAPAVIICPGGAYGGLAYGKEGTQLAKYLNGLGVSAFVLKYRVPQNRPGAAQDAQRAVRFARANARELGIDPFRVGMAGFSAGGHLTALTASNYRKDTYEPSDCADKMSSRPDFTILIYPAYTGRGDLGLQPEITADASTPPCFIAQTMDDGHIGDGLAYFLAMRRAGAEVEAHFFDKGGHGYGMRERLENTLKSWPALMANWLEANGISGGKE